MGPSGGAFPPRREPRRRPQLRGEPPHGSSIAVIVAAVASKRELPHSLRRRAFTTADLAAAGSSEDVIRRAGISTASRGVHVDGEVDETIRLRALGLVLPAGSAFACHTAAQIWSLPLEGVTSAGPPTVHVRATRQVRRAGVDSPMESLLRLVLMTAGLPEPAINVDVRDSHGGWIARPDLSYPHRRITARFTAGFALSTPVIRGRTRQSFGISSSDGPSPRTPRCRS